MSLLLALTLLTGSGHAVEPGRYGLELVLGSDADLPVIGQTPGTSRSWSLVDIRETDGQLMQHHQTCAVRMEGRTGKTSVHLPRAFIDALPRREVTLEEGERYRADLGEDAIGFDPALGPMPAALDDPSLTDSDKDGQPGATVELHLPIIGVVQLFVVQQAHVRLEGTLGEDGVVTGTVEMVAFDQRTLGASMSFFDRSPEVTPRGDRSSFRLVPMPDLVGCADVRPAFCARGDSPGACGKKDKSLF